MYRRGVLHAVGVGTVTLASGCLGFSPDQPRYLESVSLRNDDSAAHTFELVVERNQETVQRATVELNESAGPSRLDCAWDGRGPFTVTCRLQGEQQETVSVATVQEGTGEYAHLTFVVTTDGKLASSAYLDDGGMRQCSGTPAE